MYQNILDSSISIPIHNLFISPELQQEAVAHKRTSQVPPSTSASNTLSLNNKKSPPPPPALEYAALLCVIPVCIAGKQSEHVLLDKGSKIVVIRADLAKELGVDVNQHHTMLMGTANDSKEALPGCAEYLEITVDGLPTFAHAFIVPSAPYQLLLGHLWQRVVCIWKWETVLGVLIQI